MSDLFKLKLRLEYNPGALTSLPTMPHNKVPNPLRVWGWTSVEARERPQGIGELRWLFWFGTWRNVISPLREGFAVWISQRPVVGTGSSLETKGALNFEKPPQEWEERATEALKGRDRMIYE